MGRPKTRDYIKGEILNGMLVNDISAREMAEAVGVSKSKFYKMLKQHTDSWKINQISAALKMCGLTLEIKVAEQKN